MRFSWRALVWSPMVVTLLVGGGLALATSNKKLEGFLLFTVLAGIISYGVTCCMFLPALWIVSRFTKLTNWLVIAIGFGISVVVCYGIVLQSYWASGVDSGPPTEPFLSFFSRMAFGLSWPFLVAGLITSSLYAFFTRPKKV